MSDWIDNRCIRSMRYDVCNSASIIEYGWRCKPFVSATRHGDRLNPDSSSDNAMNAIDFGMNGERLENPASIAYESSARARLSRFHERYTLARHDCAACLSQITNAHSSSISQCVPTGTCSRLVHRQMCMRICRLCSPIEQLSW